MTDVDVDENKNVFLQYEIKLQIYEFLHGVREINFKNVLKNSFLYL